MIDEKVRNFGPIIAAHHLPQFPSAYLEINAGGITTEINDGNKIIAATKSAPATDISSSFTNV